MNSDHAVEFMSELMKNADASGMRWGTALMKTQQWAAKKGDGFYSDLNLTEQIFGDPAMPVFMKGGPGNGGGSSGTITPSKPVTGTF